jgi:hypothetical protein
MEKRIAYHLNNMMGRIAFGGRIMDEIYPILPPKAILPIMLFK